MYTPNITLYAYEGWSHTPRAEQTGCKIWLRCSWQCLWRMPSSGIPSSPILFTLMMKAIHSSKKSVHTWATQSQPRRRHSSQTEGVCQQCWEWLDLWRKLQDWKKLLHNVEFHSWCSLQSVTKDESGRMWNVERGRRSKLRFTMATANHGQPTPMARLHRCVLSHMRQPTGRAATQNQIPTGTVAVTQRHHNSTKNKQQTDHHASLCCA
jgi:hypothetical protein